MFQVYVVAFPPCLALPQFAVSVCLSVCMSVCRSVCLSLYLWCEFFAAAPEDRNDI